MQVCNVTSICAVEASCCYTVSDIQSNKTEQDEITDQDVVHGKISLPCLVSDSSPHELNSFPAAENFKIRELQ